MKKKILFIMNPISGTASKAAVPSLIDSVLDKELFEYEIRMTERAGHASEIATEAKNNHVDVVVAVGGDGTVNEVARSLVHSDTALGILPCGSGNGLARHLLLPMNLKKCIEVINQCEIRDLDYGVINDHPFFCTCGMGFDAFVSMKFAESGKRGPITYAENILREGLKYKPETYTLEDETGTVNLVVWPDTVTRWGEPLLGARLLAVEGIWQSSSDWGGGKDCGEPAPAEQAGQEVPAVRHLIVHRARDMSRWLGRLGGAGVASRNFH